MDNPIYVTFKNNTSQEISGFIQDENVEPYIRCFDGTLAPGADTGRVALHGTPHPHPHGPLKGHVTWNFHPGGLRPTGFERPEFSDGDAIDLYPETA